MAALRMTTSLAAAQAGTKETDMAAMKAAQRFIVQTHYLY